MSDTRAEKLRVALEKVYERLAKSYRGSPSEALVDAMDVACKALNADDAELKSKDTGMTNIEQLRAA